MNPNRAADVLGVTRKTILAWIDHPVLEKFFSEDAKGSGGRDIAEQDLYILNTINYLRKNMTRDWHEIAEYIDDGYRNNDFGIRASTVNTGDSNMEIYSRNVTLAEENRQLQDLADGLRKENEELQKAIQHLYEQIGYLKGRLSHYEETDLDDK